MLALPPHSATPNSSDPRHPVEVTTPFSYAEGSFLFEGCEYMSDRWLEIMRMGGGDVWDLVERHGDRPAESYQFKWDVLRSVASRAIAGRLRHLPSGDSATVFIKLPI